WVLRGTPALSAILLVAGAVVAAIGGGLLMLGGRAEKNAREAALTAPAEAQGRTNALHRRRAENEAGLGDLARIMGHRDSVDLLRQWNEYARLLEDSGPLLRAQET